MAASSRRYPNVLLIRSRTNAKWLLLKGWVISGQVYAASAQQEAEEEAGVIRIAYETPIGTTSFGKKKMAQAGPSQALVSLQVTEELSKWTRRGSEPEAGLRYKMR